MPIKFQKDKLMHYLACFAITFFGCLFGGPAVGVGAGAAAGIGKEVYDDKYGTGFSRADLFADAAGIVVGFVAYAATWWYLV